MVTAALTDASALVDEAFESLECGWDSSLPHDGPKAAFLDYHGCWDGWVCAGHYREFINELAILLVKLASGACCAKCGAILLTIESFVTAYPL